jgi:hypothetical protein
LADESIHRLRGRDPLLIERWKMHFEEIDIISVIENEQGQ